MLCDITILFYTILRLFCLLNLLLFRKNTESDILGKKPKWSPFPPFLQR